MNWKTLTQKDKLVFEKIQERLGAEFVEFFDGGSTARVYRVRLPIGVNKKARVDRIIKVFRTSEESSQGFDPKQVFQNEVAKLVTVCHNNVVSVYDAGYLKISSNNALPYYVMEFVPGALDLDAWLEQHIGVVTRETIIQLLLQAACGIEALHRKGIIHCDLKFGNMLVGDSETLKIADLGFAKSVTRKPGKTGLYTTHHYFPAAYRQYEEGFQDKRQMYVELPRECIIPAFDLHYFGRIIRDIISSQLVDSLLSRSDRRSLNLLIDRMDLDRSAALLSRYENATQVVADLQKMQSLYLFRAGVEELGTYTGTRTVRIPVSGDMPFTERVSTLIHHPMFFRLNNAHQLGLTHYVFPGAIHTRLEHSLGVYANVAHYINSLLADDHQPYFRQLVDEEMIVTALLAGLLHDIGQHSFSHSLEDVGLTKPRHEAVAAMFIEGKKMSSFVKLDEHKEPLKDLIERHWPEVNIDRLCWLITGERRPKQTVGLGWEIVRAIISGPIDADKTDYLLRDALHAGVEYARSIDITRFMNSLSASLLKKDNYVEGVLAVTWKGKQSAENIILARSQMFWVLYWHHAVRCAHAMLAHACAHHLRTLSPEDKLHFNAILYWGTVGEFITYLQSSDSERAKELAGWLKVRRLFKRGIALDYGDDKDLYQALLNKKVECEERGDRILQRLSRNIANAINETLVGKGLTARLSENDVIVDVPKPGKDELGQIYVVEKNAEVATPYNSLGLIGNFDDWQNRVRTIRVFLDPRVDVDSREKIALEGKRILQRVT